MHAWDSALVSGDICCHYWTKTCPKSEVITVEQDENSGEEGIQFITDTTGDPALQQDFLPFQLDDESLPQNQDWWVTMRLYRNFVCR